MSYDSAAAVPVALTTAALGLYANQTERGGAGLTPPWEADGAQKYAGKPILILGGSSSVGQFGEYLWVYFMADTGIGILRSYPACSPGQLLPDHCDRIVEPCRISERAGGHACHRPKAGP